jgi:hypothetical protein
MYYELNSNIPKKIPNPKIPRIYVSGDLKYRQNRCQITFYACF